MTFIIAEAAGRTYCFHGPFTIGASRDCGLTVDDEYVSLQHAVCYINEDGQWVIEDLGSVNGTWIKGGSTSGPVILLKGDRVTVGRTTIIMVPS